MNHGYNSMKQIKTPPLLEVIGLAEGGNDYHFQGKLGAILEFMAQTKPAMKVKATGDLPGAKDKIVVDINDIASSAADEYRKAVIAATPGANVLMALRSALKSSKSKPVVIILRNGRTAPPVTAPVRFEITSPATLAEVAEGIAIALKPSAKGKAGSAGDKAAQVLVAGAKTAVKVIQSLG